jgi:hypothetical protein
MDYKGPLNNNKIMDKNIKAVFDKYFDLEIGVRERQELLKKELGCDHETFTKYLKEYITETWEE